jgi:NAD(P)-dependent dehydrogenase (short-subunit alcohol dehydrogenase family)
MARFTGKVAVVTGAGGGIGRSTAEALAREEAQVALVDIKQELLDETVKAIVATGGEAIGIRADVSKVDDARRIADQTIAAFGGIDVLVNNAAIEIYGTVVDTPEDEWDRVVAVNLRGVYLMSRFCIPSMVTGGGGSVVHVASVQAFTCLPRSAAYVATKGAVVALTRAMALDHAAEKVRVNCVCPGSIETPLLREAAEQEADPGAMFAEWGRRHPIGRIGKPAEVAEVILFLASDQSSFVTGSPYLVDGALSAAAWW